MIILQEGNPWGDNSSGGISWGDRYTGGISWGDNSTGGSAGVTILQVIPDLLVLLYARIKLFASTSPFFTLQCVKNKQ